MIIVIVEKGAIRTAITTLIEMNIFTVKLKLIVNTINCLTRLKQERKT